MENRRANRRNESADPGAYDAAAADTENDTALVLDGRDSLRELWLYLRALERRGLLDPSDAAAAQADLSRIRRALEVAHDAMKRRRTDPLGERGRSD